MPISALPQSTVRLLGSSLVITKPCDVVKELIDNAIDAGAGLVEIVVSPNCLDTIRVRDDGRGIDVDDFDALGRRAHTSKLKAFDELGLRAGESLGFRGEALAAVNALAVVAITTRTAKDVIATRLQLKSAVGGVENRRPVSAPVGTTVQVTRLFEALPARRQHSLKHSAKHIQAVKDLLTSYALARPDLRLSLKMVGETTYSWSYAPVCASGVDEAALQVFGKALANSCIHVSRNSACDQATPLQFDQQPPQDFILDALIPKPGFDAQAVKGKGLYLSVDSRPISSACDMAKKMTTIFKTCLNRIADTNGPCANISNPFMRLNIRCPPGSYDANVTPLKDEVVFGDEDRIAACFAGLCRKLYAERSVDDFFSSKRPSQHKRAAAQALAASVDCSESMQPCLATEYSSSTQLPTRTEQLTVLQGGAWNMARPTMQGNAPSSLTLESRSQERILPAKMRTSKAVNMSRTNSNSTDEDGAANSVDVQVPASLTTATHVPSGQRPDSGAPISKVSASENIERYLLSRKSGAFQIATDETATKRKQQPYTASKPPAEGSGRMPLQPLTESTLNTMRGETESDSDASSDELEMLEPDNNAEGIVAAYRRRQGARRTPPGSLRPSLELGSLEPHSPPPSNGVAEWPTPPSSGPLRSARPLNSPFRTPQRPPLRRDSPAGQNNTHARSWLRASGGGGVIPFSLPGQSRIQRPAASEQTAKRAGLTSTPGSSLRETPPQRHSGGVHGLNRQRDNPIRGFMHVSEELQESQQPGVREQVSQRNLSLYKPSPTDLMRSLSPSVTRMAGAARGGADADDDVSTAQTCDIFSPDIFVGGASHDAAPVNKVNGVIEDPRLYFIKRRRSQARHGIARRLSSHRLPLGAIPNHSAMQSASTSRGVCLKKVKRLARQACLLGYDAMPGNWGYAIEFKNMEDAGEVESRLHQAVNAWKRTQRQAVEVEYTLRSAAKGKSMGC